MRPLIAIAAGLFFAAVLLLPAFGPLLDHHFAERMPNHQHLHESVVHTHTHDQAHSHAGDGMPDTQDGSGGAVPLVNADGSVTGLASPILDQTVLVDYPGFEPSNGPLRLFVRSEAVMQIYAPPPRTPPKSAA
jgi:hypothetical protein